VALPKRVRPTTLEKGESFQMDKEKGGGEWGTKRERKRSAAPRRPCARQKKFDLDQGKSGFFKGQRSEWMVRELPERKKAESGELRTERVRSPFFRGNADFEARTRGNRD